MNHQLRQISATGWQVAELDQPEFSSVPSSLLMYWVASCCLMCFYASYWFLDLEIVYEPQLKSVGVKILPLWLSHWTLPVVWRCGLKMWCSGVRGGVECFTKVRLQLVVGSVYLCRLYGAHCKHHRKHTMTQNADLQTTKRIAIHSVVFSLLVQT